MTQHQHINLYFKAIAAIGGDATEFSYRTAIDNLLKSTATAFGIAANILQEPSRTKHIGAPDFRVNAEGGGVIGYVECKKPGVDLRSKTIKEQLEKYRSLSANMLLTDSWQWILLRDGKPILQVQLSASSDAQTESELTELLRAFMRSEPERIGDSKRLAEALASRCAILRNGLQMHEQDDPKQSRLHSMLADFRKALNAELSFAQFVDTFAQTLVYSLLLAKLNATAGKKLDLYNINGCIPQNFALIREITTFLHYLNNPQYKKIEWVVDDILAIINAMDAAAVTESMSYQNKHQQKSYADDPYLYFYENFLAAYDADLREQRGVYYTPSPVVNFIVRAVDDLLKTDFDLADGLADYKKVTALDFAAGTGTFMLEMIRTVLQNADPARRDMLTHEHLLKNFYGFELLIAPYVIAHLKLSQFLADHGAPLQSNQRLKIYLTNTLEQLSQQIELPMMLSLAEEANHAQAIKEQPVLVITGNPPYSGESQNKGAWIKRLIKDYKKIDGKPLDQKNLKWLNDDYVKFIRFAQWKMDQVERGIIAIITNHGFLDNPTFLGMRKSLLDTFDTLYFLDLHGNAKREETTPDGGKDENVFDIEQGVSISIFVKNPNAKQHGVFHADLYGKRTDKYKALLEHNLDSIKWKTLTLTESPYLFIPSRAIPKAYKNAFSIKNIFSANVSGIVTARDHFAVAFTDTDIKNRINDLRNKNIHTEKLREKYNLNDTLSWQLEKARALLKQNYSFDEYLQPCMYRPFDERYCYYGKEIMEGHRPKVMRHMLAGENLGLVTVHQARSSDTWRHCFVAERLMESSYISNKSGEINYLFPLYRYDTVLGQTTKVENFTHEFRGWINEKYATAPSPEDILACIYAIMHSPDYRQRYGEFLRIDYPQIPFPDTDTEFTRLATIGEQLINAHLLRKHCNGKLAEHQGSGTNRVEQGEIRYDEPAERLYFNKNEYFAPVPADVYHFQIGGYQPLKKYLKSRENRTLTLSDTDTLRKATNSIAFTIEQMKKIDE